MRGFAVRFAGILLCASALSGCGAFGDDNAVTMPRPGAADPSPIAADVTSAVQQAQALRLKGDFEAATRILSETMLAAPDDARVVGEYGKLLAQEGHSGDAIQFLRRAIELQPNDWTLYSALGVAFDQSGDHDNARVAYERGLGLKPHEPAILNNYAMSRMLAGDPVAARTLMIQAKAAGSADPRIEKNLAMLDRLAPAPTRTANAEPPASTLPVTPVKPVASSPMPPMTAKADRAPTALGGPVMLGQPVGPNGPVEKPAKTPVKVAAHPARPAKHNVAANTPPKPSKVAKADKPAKPSKDQIPALRMAADTGKP